ncbi:MAG: hypothetical protein ACFFCV_11730 [Promethearchaeota archaeon]
MFFANSFYPIFIASIIIMIFATIYCYKKQKYEFINVIGFYLCSIIFFISLFILIENIIKVVDLFIISIFTLEMFLILLLYTWIYYIIYKRSEGKTFYIYSAIVLIFAHIIISGLFMSFISGTIIIVFVGVIIFISISKMNEYRRQLYIMFGLGWYFYILYLVLNELVFGLYALLIIIVIVSLGYRPITGRLITLYHTMRTITNFSLFGKSKILVKRRTERTLFWMTKVIITQIGKEDRLEKKKLQTWLQDFFRHRKSNRVQIMLNKDQFEFSFLIKTRTKIEGIRKGNQLFIELKSTYKGLDGKLEHFEVNNKFLYKKERLWEIRFPKAPYRKRIDLINRLITLFGEDHYKITLQIIWRKAFPRKLLEQRAKIVALKYKDSVEKNTYLKMWRDELYHVKIYISYEVTEKDLGVRSPEFHAMQGRIRILESAIKNEEKSAKIKRVLCGARADFLRGILYNGRYLTPISLDFTFNDKMPFLAPVGLKKQVIDWSKHSKNNTNFSVGKWIDEYGRLRENLLYIKVDDLVQGANLIGGMGTGKSFLLGFINFSISQVRPDVGILILNYKRELEENIYSAEKVYKFGEDFNLPYILPLTTDKMEKQIVQVSQAVMGSIGFEEEGVYACKYALQNYILNNGGPPESITELLELVRNYFYEEGHEYDDKYQAKITSALNTRINTQLSNPILVNTLNPFNNVGNWYEDWLNGKIVQIDLYSCNEWEQRLISILILQTIRTLTPDLGVKGLKHLIEIDEAHRIFKKLTSPGKHKSDDYIACEQIIKIFEIMFSEFRDRGISFFIADQRADILDDSAISLPSLKFLMHQSLASVECFTKDPQKIETIIRLTNRYCVLDLGATGEFFSFKTADYIPVKFYNKEIAMVSKVLCPSCEKIIDITHQTCPYCNYHLILNK